MLTFEAPGASRGLVSALVDALGKSVARGGRGWRHRSKAASCSLLSLEQKKPQLGPSAPCKEAGFERALSLLSER